MAELDWKVIGTGIFRGNMLLADTADSKLSRIGKVAVSTQIVYEHNSHAELLKACEAAHKLLSDYWQELGDGGNCDVTDVNYQIERAVAPMQSPPEFTT